ncbi:MAG: UDP-2,4-diacetamido-2,4,6-trideoxy-beta-L-altropyranose hydrolase [Bacteroidota bacterium]
MVFVIRSDASAEIGSGHIMRCLALGQALQDGGQSVVFLTQTRNRLLVDRLIREGFDVEMLETGIPVAEDGAQTATRALKRNAAWVITDGYRFDTSFQRILKQSGVRLMCIDDIAECHYVSDIVLNQNVNAEKVFRYSCESYTTLLLGTRYALLRREFLKARTWTRLIAPECSRILVTMGGSDAGNASGKVLEALNLLHDVRLHVKVLLGPAYPKETELRADASGSPHTIEVYQAQENLVPIMQWADLAITAAGSTVWELAALGTPMMVGILADNQEPVALNLQQEGAGENTGWYARVEPKRISENILALIRTPEKRGTLSANARNLIDGSSMKRVCMALYGDAIL